MKTALILMALIVPMVAQEVRERVAKFEKSAGQQVVRNRPKFAWSADGKTLTYEINAAANRKQTYVVDLLTGRKTETQDPKAMLNQSMDAVPLVAANEVPRRSRTTGNEQTLRLENATSGVLTYEWVDFSGANKGYGEIPAGGSTEVGTYAGHVWRVLSKDGKLFGCVEVPNSFCRVKVVSPAQAKPQARRARDGESPDGKWQALIQDGRLMLRPAAGGDAVVLGNGSSSDGFRGRIFWSPDSSRVVAFQVRKVNQRMVTMVESSPKDQIQPKVITIPYTKPGDEIEQPMPKLFDVNGRKEVVVSNQLFANPWSIREESWSEDSGEFQFVYNQRGHQVMRILGIRASTGEVRVIHEETSKTFLDYSQKYYFERLPATREILWMSERDGWNHLYLIDEKAGKVKRQLTRGEWNVHKVVDWDAEKRSLLLEVLGIHRGQDPYYSHFIRVSLDGAGPTVLTDGNGTHEISFSPDGRHYVDRWSRVDQPPVFEVRRSADGKRVTALDEADDGELRKAGWSRMEPLMAKGRDGKTEIYGVICKPVNFDPAKKYPVVEHIYAGPHDFFVPKGYSAWTSMNAIAEYGFIVVMIDGMGTNWRGRAFHDVAWKNLADAGLPDHIAWLKAAAATRPWMDLSRVGIYGGSAGGQNALSALLNHPEFYKVGVADCGCHDNRMDKIWWNEAWMGWPVDESYARNSNVVNAHKLQGKLMLVVGELDRNVDPASTMQVVNALEKADKDFDLVVVTGADHGAAETPYGRRRRANFLVEHLIGSSPK